MADKRKVYSRELKEQAVELLNTSGKPGNQIEAELGIGNGVIYRWRRQLQKEGPRAFPGNGNERDKEVAELRRELAEVREERDILRKALQHLLGSTPEMKYRFVEQQRQYHRVGHNRVARLMSAPD